MRLSWADLTASSPRVSQISSSVRPSVPEALDAVARLDAPVDLVMHADAYFKEVHHGDLGM